MVEWVSWEKRTELCLRSDRIWSALLIGRALDLWGRLLGDRGLRLGPGLLLLDEQADGQDVLARLVAQFKIFA